MLLSHDASTLNGQENKRLNTTPSICSFVTGYLNESIDLTVLESFKDFQRPGEPDFIESLIGLFVADTQRNLSALNYAIMENDKDEVKRLAHQMKGSAGNIGAHHMAGICGQLEEKALPIDEAKAAAFRLQSDFETVIKILDARTDCREISIERIEEWRS